jgi:ABC-type spermidine/putrescine transport system permease subunit I
MIACLIAHATAIWDVSYAYRTREVTPTEQHVHAFLEMLPLMGLLIVITVHWQQFLSLFGLSQQAAEFAVRLREPPLPWIYVSASGVLALVMLAGL